MHYTQIFTQNYLNALIFVVCSRSKNEYLPHLDLKSTILCYNVLRAAGNVKDAGTLAACEYEPGHLK